MGPREEEREVGGGLRGGRVGWQLLAAHRARQLDPVRNIVKREAHNSH